MKQYKQKDGNFFYFKKYFYYYTINYDYHGLFTSLYLKNNKIAYKGYYNMGMEYSHWRYCGFFF